MILLLAGTILPVLLPSLVAFLLLRRFLPRPPGCGSAWDLLQAAMAMAFGVAGTSGTWFAWLVLFGRPGTGYWIAESIALLAVGGFAWFTRADWSDRSETLSGESIGLGVQTPHRPANRWLLAAALGLGLAWIGTFLGGTVRNPNGHDDALAMWNIHARALHRGAESQAWAEFLRHGKETAYHADYPLMLPAAIARLWAVQGDSPNWASAGVALWFAIATVLLCGAVVAFFRGADQGILAALALLGTRHFVTHASSQFADVPFACLVLCAIAGLLFAFHDDRHRRGWLAVIGISAGLAAWTKNEGLLLVLVLGVVYAGVAARRRSMSAVRDALPLGAGLAYGLSLVAVFKTGFAPENDLVAGQSPMSTIERLTDVSRYAQVSLGVAAELYDFAKALLIVLVIYALLMRRGTATVGRSGRRAALGVVALAAAGYFAVFVTTPHALDWHLATAAGRLWLHLWPSLLALYFLFVATPSERLERIHSHPAGSPVESSAARGQQDASRQAA